MDTHKKNRENISALVDGELPDTDVELAFAALDGDEGQAAWKLYHRIGDALRADAAGVELSEGFEARLAARLAQEPVTTRRAARGAAGAAVDNADALMAAAAAVAVATR